MRPEVHLLRQNVSTFITETIFATKIDGAVLEVGPMQQQWTPVKELFIDTRKHFAERGISYLACDIDDSSSCEIICNILSIGDHIEKESLGAIMALEVMEHVSKIWELPSIFHSLLRPGGKLFISTPYYFYRHAPFPDYWRISEDGLRFLFSDLFEVEITPLILDDERKPLHYTMVATKK